MSRPNQRSQTSFEATPTSGDGDATYKNVPNLDDPDMTQSSMGQAPSPQVPILPPQQILFTYGSGPSGFGASPPQAVEMSSHFPPTITLDNHEFEFHEDQPIFGNFPIPAEFLRVPTGSSVYEPDSVLEESGRTYHGYKDGKYFLPNDAAEQDRLDFQHAGIMILYQGHLSFAPIHEPENVLDVATGTGIWALDFARQHPTSNVIGTDLSSIQPDTDVPNCSFVKDDSEEEWLFGGIQFDYIHLRLVYTCFNDHKIVMKHAFDNMKPGAWIEYQDGSMECQSMDGDFEGTAMDRMFRYCTAGAAAVGRDLAVTKHYKEWLIEAGFVDVTERKFICPCNPWPSDPRLKRVGQYMLANLREGMRGIAWRMLKLAGLSAPEIETLSREFQEQCGDTSCRWFSPSYIVYGRKPYEGEVNGTLPLTIPVQN